METLNLVDIFKTYIEEVAPEEDKKLFEEIFLGKRFSSDGSLIYTKEEYFDHLRKIMNANGQGYTYGEFAYVKREPSSLEQALTLPRKITESFQKTIIFPIEKSPVYMNFIKDFNSFVLNPIFVFVLLDKIYDVPESVFHTVMKESQSNCELDGMFERWKDYFVPIVKDFCSYNYYFVKHLMRLVYISSEKILISDGPLFGKTMKQYGVKCVYSADRNKKINPMFNYE